MKDLMPLVTFAGPLTFGAILYLISRHLRRRAGQKPGTRVRKAPGRGTGHDFDDALDLDVFPKVNTNGNMMIPGTGIDVTGRPFGS